VTSVEKRLGYTQQPRSPAFLLAQVGAHAAARFAERLRELDLVPPHAGILRALAANPGISQQALASLLGMVPSRLVTWLDELEERGLLVRRDHADDRRLYALHLTDEGMRMLGEIGRVAVAHGDSLCASLPAAEREQLTSLLLRIADEQELTTGVHPGFARLEDAPSKKAPRARALPQRSRGSKR
jgi:DNA-binding MarR family transcriptional regulator